MNENSKENYVDKFIELIENIKENNNIHYYVYDKYGDVDISPYFNLEIGEYDLSAIDKDFLN